MKYDFSQQLMTSYLKRGTLLIPSYLSSILKEKYSNSAEMRNLLSLLLRKYYQNEARLIVANKKDVLSVQYQEKGLKLIRFDFRAYEHDWAHLKILARAYNISVCNFFVLLLVLEIAGVWTEEGGVPPKHPVIFFQQKLNLHLPTTYRYKFHIKV